MRRTGALFSILFSVALAHAQSPTAPQPKEGDFVLRNFHFRSGETLPELRLHFATLGTPIRDAHGAVQNAVMILHGTTRSGRVFLNPAYMAIYGSGQPMDLSRSYVILPDPG
jgi:homoserine O-acetyltransferase/O-succinyltransferase